MNNLDKSFTDSVIKDLWQTPKELFTKLNNEFRFTADICASHENCLHPIYYTEDQNALTSHWFDSNWCNPPYSNIKPWVDKAIEQHQEGKTVVMLVPADTSVGWFKTAYDSCNEVRFISGRLSFVNAKTQKAVSGNNKGSMLIIWKANAPKGSRILTLINRSSLMEG